MSKLKMINPPTKALALAVSRHGIFVGDIETPLQISHVLASVSETRRDGRVFDPGDLRAADLKHFSYLGPFECFAARAAHLTDILFRTKVNLTLWIKPGSKTGKRAASANADKTFYGATVTTSEYAVLLRIIAMKGKAAHINNEKAVLYLESRAKLKPRENMLFQPETLFVRD